MQKTTIDKESNLNTEAKSSSQQFNKSQRLDDRKNGTSNISLGQKQPIREEKRVRIFVDDILNNNPKNPSKNTHLNPSSPPHKLKLSQQDNTYDDSNRQLNKPFSNSNEMQRPGNSALKYIASHSLQSSQNNKVTSYSVSPINPFAINRPKAYPQSRIKIFVEKEKSGSETPSSKLNVPEEEKQVNSSKEKLIPNKEQSLKSKHSEKQSSSQFNFKPPSVVKSIGELSDSFDFAPPPPKLSVNNKSSMDIDSDQDISNLYDRGQAQKKSKIGLGKQKINSTSKLGFSMLALQRILEVSNIYKDYLKNGSQKRQPSIYLNELDLVEKSKLPQEFFFKPERVVFNKIKQDLLHQYSYNGFHILCKVNEDRTKFFFQDLKIDQLKNLKGIKCSQINLPKELKMNKNVQYDHENKRFYLFSNAEQKIYVYSQASRQLLCQIKVKKQVYEPHLFLHHISNRIFLLVIGGFTKVEKNVVQGSKFIEIFELKKWQIELSSQVIKLSIGRISPIIMTTTEKNQTKILILGGNTIATVDRNGQLNYSYQRQINQSTNLTGTSIPSQEIIQLFDYEQAAVTSLHPVKISHSTFLHDGCVIPINNTYLLLLPKCKRLIQVKIMNKEIIVIQGKHYNYIPNMNQLQKRQVCLHMGENGIVLYRISQNGIFQMISQDDKTQSSCICQVY